MNVIDVVAEKVLEFNWHTYKTNLIMHNHHLDYRLFFKNWQLSTKCKYLSCIEFTQNIDSNPTYIDLLNKQSKSNRIIIDLSVDPLDTKIALQHPALKNLSSNFVFFTNQQSATHNTKFDIRFFPTWIARACPKINTSYFTKELPDSDYQLPRPWSISCLNRQPRKHRYYTYYKLTQFDWFPQCFTSFGGRSPIKNQFGDIFDEHELRQVLGLDAYKWFLMNQHNFPISSQKDYNWENCHDPGSPAYSQSYVNIATETSIDLFCPTEKTTKPLYSGNIFLPIASKNFVAEMESFGFDLAYQGLDPHIYDQLNTWQERVDACLAMLHANYYNIQDIWNNNVERLMHNRNLMDSQNLANSLMSEVKDLV